MDGINLSKHHALSSSSIIKDLFNPILQSIGITYFNYLKIHNSDSSRELLTNNPHWIEHFYKNQLYNSLACIDIEHLKPKGYFLWSEVDTKDPAYLHGKDYFNIDHGITFIIKRKEFTYLYIFASGKEHFYLNNFYLSNIDLLQHFIHYFNDQAKLLIQEASQNKIYLPQKQIIPSDTIEYASLHQNIRKNFLEKTKVDRYFLLNQADDLYLTKKQVECAKLLSKGFSSKIIAKELNISPRTVEGYLYELKNKLEHSFDKKLSKHQLIQFLNASNVI
jgi:DNA-binding CsgD family transcriptional regulator